MDGNIIVHSHPYKPGADHKPLHNHTKSAYILVYLLNNILANEILILHLSVVVLIVLKELYRTSVNDLFFRFRISPQFLRGPPEMVLV